jgi:hypothetical protein
MMVPHAVVARARRSSCMRFRISESKQMQGDCFTFHICML